MRMSWAIVTIISFVMTTWAAIHEYYEQLNNVSNVFVEPKLSSRRLKCLEAANNVSAANYSYCASHAEEPFEWKLHNGTLRPLMARHHPATHRRIRKSTLTTVHTFWLDVGVGNTVLLDFWAKNWERHGWTTRVLGLGASMAHPKYEATCAVFETYPSVNVKAYTMNNMLRWLGVVYVGGSWMADYDVAIFSPPPQSLPNGGALTVHQYATPAIVSGSPEEFGRVASLFGTFYQSTDEAFRAKVFEIGHCPHVSDQQLLWGLVLRELVKFTHDVTSKLSLEDTTAKSLLCRRRQTQSIVAFHFSHEVIEQLTVATTEANSTCVCGQPTASVIDSDWLRHRGHQRLALVRTCVSFWDSGCLKSHPDCSSGSMDTRQLRRRRSRPGQSL